MADVMVRVELGDNRAYLPGERVDGFVYVTAPDVIDCQPLFVRLTRAASVADVSKTEVVRQELLRGELSPGEHQYRFTLEIPSGQLPMDLPWQVEAIVGLEWKSDPRHALPLSLKNRGLMPGGLTFDNHLSPWWTLVGVAALLGAPGGVWLAWANDFAVREHEGVFWGFVISVASCGFLGWVVRLWVGRLTWGRVQLTMHGTPQAGQPLICTLRVSRAVTLKHAVVRLEGTSWSRSSTSSKATHWSRQEGFAAKSAGEGARLEAGGTLEVTLGVPHDAHASFQAPLQGMRWELSAVLHAPGRPKCELGHEVTVAGR